MAAQQASSAAIGDDGYRSEDEDSTVETDFAQWPQVEDPVITIEENSALKHDSWAPRNPHSEQGEQNWQYYIPAFTRPGYDDNLEISEDGMKERPRRGDFWSLMRPALLSTDPPASQYAQ